jgi:hypothetical protein
MDSITGRTCNRGCIVYQCDHVVEQHDFVYDQIVTSFYTKEVTERLYVASIKGGKICFEMLCIALPPPADDPPFRSW